ncbi:Phosphatidylglycerol/phosphatidylinositol transfer protein [Xanthoria parietina]
MKLTLSVPLLLSTLVASKSFLFGNQQQPLVDDSLSVPGDNPLSFCANPSDYILTIEKVDLDPNPPEKGKALQIKAKGNFTQKIEQDAYINLSVKYGLITLINTQADLCEQMKEVDESCPLEGAKDFTKDVTLPKQIPRGTYTVLADVYTKTDVQITCLRAIVHFS